MNIYSKLINNNAL